MKRAIIGALAVLALSFGMGNRATAQIEQGTFMIDTYYGFPNSTKSFYKLFEDSTNYRATGFGPIGMRVEYLVADKVGIGAEVNFVKGGSTYEFNGYTYEYSKIKLRAMLRFNFHFGTTENFDAYFGVGAGYKYTKKTFTTTDPSGEETAETGGFLNLTIPVAARLAVGMKYFFIPNVGISAEIGVGGGPLVNGGLAFKF